MLGIGISQIMNSIVELFGMIYTASVFIFNFLSTPLLDQAPGAEEILGDFATYTPIELMFGPAIVFFLIFAIVKFITPL